MIQVTQVIEYLRTNLTTMRVDGAAALANAKDDSRLYVEGETIIPTLFVMLGTFVATTLSLEAFLQDYEEKLTIIICLDNKQDRTGKHAQQLVYSMRFALLKILLNYDGFDTDSHSLQYVGDQMIDMDRSRYWHKFEFKLLGRLGQEDGVSFDLDEFNHYVANWYSNDPLADEPLATDDLIPLFELPY
jgi:hypothetical protein